MLSPQYKSYLDETIALARSLCIKFEMTATLQNTYLASMGYPTPLAKEEWKYYLNLNGQYHASDSLIYVTSSDTKTEIPLTKENLQQHPLTKADYQPGGSLHNRFIKEHFNRRDFIYRIFDPIPIDVAVAAPNYKIVHYNSNLVHDRELSFMPRLQQWIDGFFSRWHITSFAISDLLYPTAMLGVFWHCVCLEMLNLRMEYIKTHEACDFHLWMYLGGYYRLDRYKRYLTNEQAMYLYRNIEYLRNNLGKESTMIDLQKNITEVAHLVASRYDVSQIDGTLDKLNQTDPIIVKSKYLEEDADISLTSRNTVEDVYTITLSKGIHNPTDYEDDVLECKQWITQSVIDTVPTGLVEFNQMPSPAESVVSAKQVRIQSWAHLSSLGYMVGTLPIELPNNTTTSIYLNDAWILFLFCLHQMSGGDLDAPLPTVLVSGVPTEFPLVTAQFDGIINPMVAQSRIIDQWIDRQIIPMPVTGLDAFSLYCDNVVNDIYNKVISIRGLQTDIEESIGSDLLRYFYIDKLCEYTGRYLTFRDWLNTVDIPFTALSVDDYLLLSVTLMSSVLGFGAEVNSISDRHEAYMAIMRLLNSYGVIIHAGDSLYNTIPYDTFCTKMGTPEIRLHETHSLDMGLSGGTVGYATQNTLEGTAFVTQLEPVRVLPMEYGLDMGLTTSHQNSTTLMYHLTAFDLNVSTVEE